MDGLLANVIAGIALVFTALTWWLDRRRGRQSQQRQQELQDAQAALKQRQLAFDEALLEFTKEVRSQADLRLTMERKFRDTSHTYRLGIQNAGGGPAFDVAICADGKIQVDDGWSLDDECEDLSMDVTSTPIERLDPQSQTYFVDFDVKYPGFHGPVVMTVRWLDSGHEPQTKRLHLTPE